MGDIRPAFGWVVGVQPQERVDRRLQRRLPRRNGDKVWGCLARATKRTRKRDLTCCSLELGLSSLSKRVIPSRDF